MKITVKDFTKEMFGDTHHAAKRKYLAFEVDGVRVAESLKFPINNRFVSSKTGKQFSWNHTNLKLVLTETRYNELLKTGFFQVPNQSLRYSAGFTYSIAEAKEKIKYIFE